MEGMRKVAEMQAGLTLGQANCPQANMIQFIKCSLGWGMGAKAIKFPTKHNEGISTLCHGVKLALLIPKLFSFLILDLAKLCR